MSKQFPVTDPNYKDGNGKLEKEYDRIMEMIRSGMTRVKIAKELNVPVGTLANYITRWKARETIKSNKIAEKMLKEDLNSVPEEFKEENDSLEDEALDRVLRDGDDEDAKERVIIPRKVEKRGIVDTSKAEKRMEGALGAASRTVAKAAAGVKVEAQSLNAAKILLKKYGLLQEEYSQKESQYAKMSGDELCERTLASVSVLMRKNGREDLVKVLDDAIASVKKTALANGAS